MINKYLLDLDILKIKFEELIAEPHATISKICFWAGVEHKKEADEIIDRKEVHFGAEKIDAMSKESKAVGNREESVGSMH
jgi:hypothetical protein